MCLKHQGFPTRWYDHVRTFSAHTLLVSTEPRAFHVFTKTFSWLEVRVMNAACEMWAGLRVSIQLDTHPKKEDPKERKILRKKTTRSLSHTNKFRSGRRKLGLLTEGRAVGLPCISLGTFLQALKSQKCDAHLLNGWHLALSAAWMSRNEAAVTLAPWDDGWDLTALFLVYSPVCLLFSCLPWKCQRMIVLGSWFAKCCLWPHFPDSKIQHLTFGIW